MRMSISKAMALGFILFLLPISMLFSQTEEATKIFEQNKEGVVSLLIYGGNKELIAKGAGFGIGQEIIATNYHLVSSAEFVEGVTAKGKKVKAEGIIAVDRNLDVVFLKVKGNVQIMSLGDSDQLKTGDRVFAIGPNETGEIIISEGTVRNFLPLADEEKYLECSLSIPEGFSGGPLLNVNGQVVGLSLILKKGTKFGVPVKLWKGLQKPAKFTEFKKWSKEDYFSVFEGAFLAGRLLAKVDETGDAQQYLEKVIKMNPSLVEAHLLLADIYTKQRDYQSAVNAFKKVLEFDDKRTDAHFGLGTLCFRMRSWNEAIASLEKGLSLKPDNKEAYFLIGNAYEELKNFAKAAEAYEKFLNLKPENAWMGYLRLGLSRMELNQYEGAIQALEEAQKGSPRDLKVNNSLAQAYQKAGQLEKAEQTSKFLTELNPPDAKYYYSNILKMYDEAGNYEKAIEAAKKIIELDPKSEMAVYNLGAMYQKLERYDEAIATFRKALEIRPNYDLALYNIGYSYSKQKKHRETIEAFKKYVGVVPEDANAWLNIGISYMLLKDFESALEPLKKSVALKPDNGAALYNLAIVYINLRDNYSARDIYKTLVTVDAALADRLKKLLR